tara:strand:+ start:4791 stop:5267 length:477 start_codon:yes stop_codon:yes gene_type:complete
MKTINLLVVILFFVSCKTNNAENKSQLEIKKEKSLTAKEVTQCDTLDEAYEQLSIKEINSLLSENNRALTPAKIMRLYYPHKASTREGNESIELKEEMIDNGNTQITLIHDNFLDDSVRGEKYKMELKEIDNKWIVVSIKRNWKCYRGHTNWGIEFCK